MMYTSKGVGINALQWDELFPHLISMCGGACPKLGRKSVIILRPLILGIYLSGLH
jgi:hypothetical protein